MASVGMSELGENARAIIKRVREARRSAVAAYPGWTVARLAPDEDKETYGSRLDAWWADVDELAVEIARDWPEGLTGAEPVAGQRRAP